MDKNSRKSSTISKDISSVAKNFNGKEMLGSMKMFMGKLSRGLMLPIAVLPVAGLFLGIGGAITGYPGVSDGAAAFGEFLKMPGDVVFGNLPVLFAVSIAVAFTNDSGVAGLSALLGWAVFNGVQASLISPNEVAEGALQTYGALYWTNIPASVIGGNMGIQSMQTSVFGGIIVGWLVSKIYWKFHETQLPAVIGFFSGTRFVLVMTFILMFPLGILFLMVWPGIGIGLEAFGNALGEAPAGLNSFAFGFFERILVPFGLHHAFYSPLWYTAAGGTMGFAGNLMVDGQALVWTTAGADAISSFLGNNDLIAGGAQVTLASIVGNSSNYAELLNTAITGDQSIWMEVYGLSPNAIAIEAFDQGYITIGANGESWGTDVISYGLIKESFDGVNPGQYMQGKFSFMIFGLPAAGAAMVMAADKENRKGAAAIIVSAAFTAFLTGITEPIEFTFLFLAPWLFFGPHALMCALSFMLANVMGSNMGMTFSGGIIDYVIYGIIPDALGKGVGSWAPAVIGAAYVPIYFFGFYFAITKLNIATPGRGTNVSSNMKMFTKADVKDKATGKKKGTAELKAPDVLKALGGKTNIKDIDACITKLRVTIKDKSKVNEQALKDLGAKGVIWISKDHVHALYGAEADPLKTQIKKIL